MKFVKKYFLGVYDKRLQYPMVLGGVHTEYDQKTKKQNKFLLHVKFVKKYFSGVYDKWLQYYMGALSLGTSK